MELSSAREVSLCPWWLLLRSSVLWILLSNTSMNSLKVDLRLDITSECQAKEFECLGFTAAFDEDAIGHSSPCTSRSGYES